MKIFWIVLIVTYLLNMIAEQYPSLSYAKLGTRTEKIYKYNKSIYIFIVVLLVLVSGLRQGVGDTYTYRDIFDTIPSNVFSYLSSDIVTEDRGFYLIVAFIKQFISTDSQVALFVFSLITIALICYGLYKYTDDVKMAIFLFITMGCFSTSMNGVRQYVAAAILFTSLPLIKERKLIPYLIVVYVAYTMHASAIIFLPLYLLNNCKGWGTVSYLLILGGIFLYVTYSSTGPIIANFLGQTQYGHYVEELMTDDKGANAIRVLVTMVPMVLSWFGKNTVNNNMKYGNIIINLNIINFVVMLLATNYWLYARFCIYFNLYSIVLLCYCMNNIFEKKSITLVKMICIVCYVFFFWYDSMTSGLLYTSSIIPNIFWR